MANKTTQVDGYIRKNKEWAEPLQRLREILLACPLAEDIKWRTPCYTSEGKNIAFIGAFKDHALLSFLKGALLKDAKKLLEIPGENTQSARVIRLKSLQEIERLAPTLKSYILEAIENEKAGRKVPLMKIEDRPVPEELQARFDQSPALEKAFRALTPGRQRAYLMLFSSAKQSATRTARIEKHIPDILAGKGPDDEYKQRSK